MIRVKKIHLERFKRFTNLTILDIPRTAKLVIIVGPNGCGKSSIFDAFLHWYRMKIRASYIGDNEYFYKELPEYSAIPVNQWPSHSEVEIDCYDDIPIGNDSLYVRTAYRNDADFTIDGIKKIAAPTEKIRIEKIIQNDQIVSENYQRLVYDTTIGVYDEKNDNMNVHDLRERLIGEVRGSMAQVFDDLLLKSISDPLGTGTFYFGKGTVDSYHYKNLSGGEKAAFDLLLDMHIKKKYFQRAIYCIDEIEAHLHTKTQGKLLREIYNIVPDHSQLWVTTHSLGSLRAAQEIEEHHPNSVCVIDFHDAELDKESKIAPKPLGQVVWNKALSITLDDLPQHIMPEIIVVCEGSTVGNKRKDFDATIYNEIFAQHSPNILFISGGSSTEVPRYKSLVNEIVRHQIGCETKVLGLIDRDRRTEEEISNDEKEGIITLPVRNIESFLFEDDVIKKLAEKYVNNPDEIEDRIKQAIQAKYDALESSKRRGNPADDLKSAAGDIYNDLISIFGIERGGSSTDKFMMHILSPLITQDMGTYKNMKAGIIDKILEISENMDKD